jgi:hypothetical protein
MKEAWLFQGAVVPVDTETTQALVAEIKRLIDVVGGMALAQRTWEVLKDKEIEEIWNIAMFTDYGIGAELSNQPFVHYARAIEAKLKEKNT